jgi:putative ABC transport system permease protein
MEIISAFATDVRRAVRALARQPGFAAVVLLTLALGIGANTAIFSLIYGILLRPFPYAEPDRLVKIESVYAKTTGSVQGASLLDLDDWRRHTRSFEQIGLHMTFPSILNTGGGPSQSVQLTFVTAEMLDALGVGPVVGRGFKPEEDIVGGDVLKAVLSYGLWQTTFGGDRDVVGRVIRLRGATYTVIGVMPPGFGFPERSDIWVPLQARYAGYAGEFWKRRDFRMQTAIARLASGMTLAQAQSEMDTLAAQLEREFPATNQGLQLRLTPLRDAEVGNVRPYLWLLLGAVVMVLLIVCVNVANLLLARGAARGRELAIRAALGAGRARLRRQLLSESLVLALVGGGLGLLLAWPALALLLRLIPVALPFWMRIEIDGAALLFNFVVAALTGLLFGLVPAWQASRTDLNLALKDSAKGAGGGRISHRLRNGLVVAEISISLLLLVGAGLMMQSFMRLQRTDLGVHTGNLLTIYLSRFVTNASQEEMQKAYTDTWTHVKERLAQLPGVVTVGASYNIPYKDRPEQREQQQVSTVGQSQEEQRQNAPVMASVVDPSFFGALGIRFVAGRNFTDSDTLKSEQVVIVSRHTAETLWPGREPIGQMLLIGDAYGGNVWRRVIGVVGDTKWHAAEAGKGFELYGSHRQYALPAIHMLLRTANDPASLIPLARRVIHDVNPDIAINDFQPMDEVITDALWQRRLWGVLFALFAGVALLLAAVGLYGVMSYLVSQRTREIGVHVALGARPLDIHRLIIGQGLKLLGLGVTLGLLGSIALSRLMTSLLFGVTAYDVPTLGGVSLLLAVVALTACFIPARRAASVDPMIALRAE